MDMSSPLTIMFTVVAALVMIVVALIGLNGYANRKRRAKLVDAMKRSRFGRTK